MRPEEYRTRQAVISVRTAQRTTGALASLELWPLEDWAWTLASFIAGSNLTSAMLANLFVSTLLDVPPLVLDREDPVPRLTRVLMQVVRQPNPLVRLDRIGRTEPQNAARETTQSVMQANDVERYRWVLDPNPCDECRARAAQTWPITVEPTSHPNCECVPVPITT